MLSRADEKLLVALQQRRQREKRGLFVAEGVRVVEELLASSIVPRFAVVSPSLEDNPRGAELARELAARMPVHRMDDRQLTTLAGTETPQGVLIVAQIPVAAEERIAVTDRACVLVLDGVQDPGNVGTLIRTADAFGAAAVVALPGTVDAWNPKVVRAAAGALFRTPPVAMSAADAGAWLARHGFVVYAGDMDGTPLPDVARAARAALVVSNEGAGLSPQARSLANELVTIPMRGPAESLNVAVAAGILLYALALPEPTNG